MDLERLSITLARAARQLSVVGVGALLILDATLGRRVLHAHDYALVAGALVLLAVLWHRQSPSTATTLAAVSSLGVSLAVSSENLSVWSRFIDAGAWPGLAETAGLALLAGITVRTGSPARATVAVTAVAVAFGAAASVRYDGPYDRILAALLFGGLACSVGAGLYLRSLEAGRRNATLVARQDERLTIARELHDVVAHHVTGIVVQAQAARLVASTRPDAANEALAEIERAGSEAMSAMRSLVGSLRDESVSAPVVPAATMRDVRELANSVTESGLAVDLAIDADDAAIPGDLAVSVFRIVQESLTNARRHAVEPSGVEVRIAQVGGELRISITDDGRGVVRRGTGFGLAGMSERAHALGGRLMAGPRPDGGWVVAAVLPLSTLTPGP